MEIWKKGKLEKGNWALGKMVFWEKDIGKNGNLEKFKYANLEKGKLGKTEIAKNKNQKKWK